MARRSTPKLKTIPTPRGSNKIPKPQVKPSIGGPFSPRAIKAQIGINVPGVKTQ